MHEQTRRQVINPLIGRWDENARGCEGNPTVFPPQKAKLGYYPETELVFINYQAIHDVVSGIRRSSLLDIR